MSRTSFLYSIDSIYSMLCRVLCRVLWCVVCMCTASACIPKEQYESQKKGIVGELCNSDQECAASLVCDNSRCVETFSETGPLSCTDEAPAGTVSCEDMCDRLVNECQRSEEDCVSTCIKTVQCWTPEAVDVFGNCTLGKTDPVLTCAKATMMDAASFCYNQILLPQERRMRCDKFVEQARTIATNANEARLELLRTNCHILGRTRPQEKWDLSQSCDNAFDPDLTTVEIVGCLNTTFRTDFEAADVATINNMAEPDMLPAEQDMTP